MQIIALILGIIVLAILIRFAFKVLMFLLGLGLLIFIIRFIFVLIAIVV